MYDYRSEGGISSVAKTMLYKIQVAGVNINVEESE